MPVDRPYEKHAFVCTFGPWCRLDGPVDEIMDVMKSTVKDAGLRDAVRVNKAGCLNQCGHGPVLVVYPEGRWYAPVDVDAARRIAVEDLVHGRAVPELAYHAERAGNNKLPHIRDADRRKKLAEQAKE